MHNLHLFPYLDFLERQITFTSTCLSTYHHSHPQNYDWLWLGWHLYRINIYIYCKPACTSGVLGHIPPIWINMASTTNIPRLESFYLSTHWNINQTTNTSVAPENAQFLKTFPVILLPNPMRTFLDIMALEMFHGFELNPLITSFKYLRWSGNHVLLQTQDKPEPWDEENLWKLQQFQQSSKKNKWKI